MSAIIPEFVKARIKRSVPAKEISPKSTPVVFFGNIENAKVATLSLNPSHAEFYTKDRLLIGAEKRLESLDSLGSLRLSDLSDDQVSRVYQSCREYYNEPLGRPYKQWFGPMERLLKQSLGVSYYDGSCCHTDIIQWATNPKWDSLSEGARAAMLSTDLPFLKELLAHYKIELILMNGVTTIRHFLAHFGKEASNHKEYIPDAEQKGLKLFSGDVTVGTHRMKYFGWNKYIQRSLSASARDTISENLRVFSPSHVQ